MNRPIILTLCDYYLPGYKAGGPITTLSNRVALLGDEFAFKIVTRDRDLGEKQPYDGVSNGAWQQCGETDAFYAGDGLGGAAAIYNVLRESKYDVLYLNSFVSPLLSIWPLLLRRLGLIPHKPVVIAPRGELAQSALANKRQKKRAFLNVARRVRLHDDVLFQASSPHEQADIQRCLGNGARVLVAPDLLALEVAAAGEWSPPKQAGLLRLLYLSRIDGPKNLAGALILLQQVKGRIDFDIIGPVSDAAYWSRCRELIEALPCNVRARYLGPVPPAQVARAMRAHDLLFLPTLGENFGHVIPEALAAGCPVLISDRTPWRNLAHAGAGWDLPLECPEEFRNVLETCIAMNAAEHARLKRAAQRFAQMHLSGNEECIEQNRQLFRAALSEAGFEANQRHAHHANSAPQSFRPAA